MMFVGGMPMVTAREYRELAVEFYKWADEAETEEVRDTYLRLASKWIIAGRRLGDTIRSDHNVLAGLAGAAPLIRARPRS
jgi:hypothetical protein